MVMYDSTDFTYTYRSTVISCYQMRIGYICLPQHFGLKHNTNCRPTVGQPSADCWPTVGRLLPNCRPTVGQQSADCLPTVARQSADRFFGELFFTITHILRDTVFILSKLEQKRLRSAEFFQTFIKHFSAMMIIF